MRWWAKFLIGGLDALILLLEAVGARGVRWEWKKRTWRQSLEARVSAWENLERGVRTRMKMCRACRTLVEGNAARCSSCGASLRGIEGGGMGRLLHLLLPEFGGSLTMALVSANVVMSILLLALGGTEGGSGDLSGLLAPSGRSLFLLGAKFGPAIGAGQVWRLVTANYLHGGIVHLLFNSIALMNLGPLIESAFGWRKLFLIYAATGVAAFTVSNFWSPYSLSIGASGSIFGLLGFAIVYGRYRAGPSARAISDQLLRWLIFMVFLFIMPMRIDHAAHIGGLIVGALLGLVVDPGEPRTPGRDRALWLATGIALLVTLGSFALMALAYPESLRLVNAWG